MTTVSTTIEITNLSYNLDGSKEFAVFLTSVLGSLQLCHWYADNYNVHQIIGDLYKDLNKVFDKVQEEIIEITKSGSCGFTMQPPTISPKDLLLYKCSPESKISEIYKILDLISNVFNSQDLKNFIGSSVNGINNYKEEILSICNRTKYLLNMVN